MGEDQEIGFEQEGQTPKHLEGYRDKERRREYLRKYQRERYHALKAARGEKSTMQKVEVEERPAQQAEQFKKPVEAAVELFREATKNDDDPVLKAINRYGPMVMKFAEGFLTNMKAHQEQQAQRQVIEMKQQRPSVMPPPGWLETPSLNRLNRMYDHAGNITPWYRQGMLYEQSLAAGGIAADVSSYAPIGMERTVHGAAEAEQQRREAYAAAQYQQQAARQRRSMAELEREAQHFPPEERPADNPPQPEQTEEPNAAEETLRAVEQAMRADNERALGMMVEYFKSRPINDFEKDLESADEYVKNIKSQWWFNLIPVQTREAFKRISIDELEIVLKREDPAKHELIERKKLKPKFSKMLEEIKGQLS